MSAQDFSFPLKSILQFQTKTLNENKVRFLTLAYADFERVFWSQTGMTSTPPESPTIN